MFDGLSPSVTVRTTSSSSSNRSSSSSSSSMACIVLACAHQPRVDWGPVVYPPGGPCTGCAPSSDTRQVHASKKPNSTANQMCEPCIPATTTDQHADLARQARKNTPKHAHPSCLEWVITIIMMHHVLAQQTKAINRQTCAAARYTPMWQNVQLVCKRRTRTRTRMQQRSITHLRCSVCLIQALPSSAKLQARAMRGFDQHHRHHQCSGTNEAECS
ncbi:hypothetical protein COO60DRAFT_1558854, partial [Scenedesmus sp. NREL 46B-D3]